MIPDFILIIGAMKSGTTTLYDYLARHPQIAAGQEKEPGFFAFEEKWVLGFDWYEAQFAFDPTRHLYALDASTDYTKYPFCKEVAERLKASAPRRFKLIYILRHPLRRIESHARHVEVEKSEVGRCLSPRKTHSLDAGISPVSLAISRYAYQVDIFAEYFDRGDLLLLTLEQLAREPDVVFGRVCAFLGIDKPILRETAVKRNVGGFYSLPRRLRHSFHSTWKRLHSITPLRRAAKMIVPRFVRAQIYESAEMSALPQGRFSLTTSEESAVTAALIPDLIRLRDRYGIDAKKEWGIDL